MVSVRTKGSSALHFEVPATVPLLRANESGTPAAPGCYMAGGAPRGVSELGCHRGLRTQSAVVDNVGQENPKMLCKNSPICSDVLGSS